MNENRIQRADLNARLTRALEIKGQKSPIIGLEPMVVPVVVVEDLTKQAEWVTPTERKLAATVLQAAVVGENGYLVVQNPVGSGVVGLVERVTGFGLSASVFFHFGLVNVLPATPAALYFRDRRVTGAPALRAFSGSNAALQIVNAYLYWQGSNAISAPWYETEGIVIQPGETFGVQCNTPNSACNLTIWAQEIPI